MDNYTGIAIALSLLLAVASDGVYIRGIINGSIVPTKSTWMIFSVVASLGAASLMANKFDLVGGFYPVFDCFLVVAIMLVSMIFGKGKKLHFEQFEKWYMVGAMACVLFWVATKDPFKTNLLIQILVLVGYAPTVHNIVANKRSCESKTTWALMAASVAVSVYPAAVQHNTLAVIYGIRGAVMCTAILFLTIKYPMKSK